MNRLLLIIAVVIFTTANLFAQLQGGSVYPINGTQAPPTSFGTLKDALNYLTTTGVTGSGQVILEFQTGYASPANDSGTVGVIPGVSATLGVTIRPGAGMSVTTSSVGGTSIPWAIRMRGTSYLTLDGRAGGEGTTQAWTIKCTGANGQSAVRMDNAGGSMVGNSIKFCILEGEAANTTSAILAVTGSTTTNTNLFKDNVFEGNIIRSGATIRGYGITLAVVSNVSNTGNKILKNEIYNFSGRGVNITGGFPGLEFSYNKIYQANSAITITSTLNGVYFSTSASPGTVINANSIYGLTGTAPTEVTGIFFFNQATSGTPVLVSNNMVNLDPSVTSASVTPASVYGIRENAATGALFNIYHNSVRIGGSVASGTANAAAYRREINSMANVKNNIFVNERTNIGTATGTYWAISSNNITSNFVPSNNIYYVSGTNTVLGTTDNLASGNKTTLTAWKGAVAGDASINGNPQYNSATDLHINPSVPTPLESGGIVGLVTTDFDGETRSSTPDIGADEGTFTGLDLASPVISYTSFLNTTSLESRTLSNVIITDNVGVSSGTNAPRIYFKKTTETTWISLATSDVGNPYSFTIDYALLSSPVTVNDTIQYFVVAQDDNGNFAGNPSAAGTGVNTITTYPTTPNMYKVSQAIFGTFDIGSGQTYTTLKAFFDAVNGSVVTGNLVANIVSDIDEGANIASLNQFAEEPSGANYTLLIKSAVDGIVNIIGSGSAVIKLNGADRVTIDGVNALNPNLISLNITNVSTSANTVAIWLASLGANYGATNNTIRRVIVNCGVNQLSATTTTFGIFVGGGSSVSLTSYGADNDNNTFDYVNVLKSRYGISLVGASATNMDINNVISNSGIGSLDTTISAGKVIGKLGIYLAYQSGAKVLNNSVMNIMGSGGTDRFGIALGSEATSSTDGASGNRVENSEISGNKIHGIYEFGTYSAVGILVKSLNTTATSNKIFNNMIWDVLANGTSGDWVSGIAMHQGNGDYVANNSIYLYGDRDPGTFTSTSTFGAAIGITSTAVQNPTVKNNIVYLDLSSNTATLYNFAIHTPSSYSFGTGASNKNLFYFPASNPQAYTAQGGTTPYLTLQSWKNYSLQDAQSFNVNPNFVSTTLGAEDLHIDVATPSYFESKGENLSSIGLVTDIDGEIRSLTPDIGADEFGGILVLSKDFKPTSINDPINNGLKSINVAFSPKVTFVNKGAELQTGVSVKAEIFDETGTSIYMNEKVTGDIPSTISFQMAFDSFTPLANGQYKFVAVSNLVGDEDVLNDTIVGYFVVKSPLVGSYVIGSTGTYMNLSGAVSELNQLGISGDVTFNIAPDYSSSTETFPITINSVLYTTGLPSTVKITSDNAMVSGGSPTSIIKLSGADKVVIENTSFENLDTTSLTSAVIWIASGSD